MEHTSIGEVLQKLMDREHIDVTQLAGITGISRQTLYTMQKKKTNQADLMNLKTLADYFHEGVEIFCGLENYQKPIELSVDERKLLSSYISSNNEGKKKIGEYATDIASNTKYRK